MAYTDAQPFKIPRPYTYQDGVDYEDITGNVTLTHASGTYQFLKDNGGSFDINLPSLRNGATYWIQSLQWRHHDHKGPRRIDHNNNNGRPGRPRC